MIVRLFYNYIIFGFLFTIHVQIKSQEIFCPVFSLPRLSRNTTICNCLHICNSQPQYLQYSRGGQKAPLPPLSGQGDIQ